MRCSSLVLALLLSMLATPAAAVRLVDSEGTCIGWGASSTAHSQPSAAVSCRTQARHDLTITTMGEIRFGRRCLGVAGALIEPGAHPGGSINWSSCIGTINLLWEFDRKEIRSRMHNLCLTRSKVADAGSVLYQMQTCVGSKRQHWRVLR